MKKIGCSYDYTKWISLKEASKELGCSVQKLLALTRKYNLTVRKVFLGFGRTKTLLRNVYLRTDMDFLRTQIDLEK